MSRACRHCGKVIACLAARRLCWTCYRDRAVRALYSPIRATGRCPEPTTDELERMIAEQMARLPDWWEGDCDRERDAEAPPKVYALVRCT